MAPHLFLFLKRISVIHVAFNKSDRRNWEHRIYRFICWGFKTPIISSRYLIFVPDDRARNLICDAFSGNSNKRIYPYEKDDDRYFYCVLFGLKRFENHMVRSIRRILLKRGNIPQDQIKIHRNANYSRFKKVSVPCAEAIQSV